MAQSTIWKAAQQVGPEGMGRISEARHNGCPSAAGQDGYEMVSRLLHERILHLHKRQALLWQERMEGPGSLPVINLYF